MTKKSSSRRASMNKLLLAAILAIIAVLAIVYFAWPPKQKLISVDPAGSELPQTPAQQTLTKVNTLCQAGLVKKAIATLEQHKSEFAGEVIVLPTLARLYLQTGQVEKANNLVEEIIELAPTNPKVWWLKGQLDLAARKNPMPSYAKAANMSTATPDIKGRYGVELFKRRKIDQARNYINQAIAGGVKDPAVFYAAGLHAKIDGKNQLALDMLSKSLTLEPKNGAGWVDLADVQKKLSMDTAVIDSLNKALDYVRGKKRQDVLFELAAALAEQKQWNQAGKYFAKASENAGPLRLLACTEAAKCYWRGGKYALAMQNIDSAYELAPNNQEVIAWRVKIENSRFGLPKTKK